MEIIIETLEGIEITVELGDVVSVYKDDDVIYFDGGFGYIPCRLSSARLTRLPP